MIEPSTNSTAAAVIASALASTLRARRCRT
jgi:hypothetical protein